MPPNPHWQPRDHLLKFRVSRDYALAVDQMAASLKVSRAMLLRESVRRGLPALVEDIAYLRSQGFTDASSLEGSLATSGRRGAQGAGPAVMRWSKRPGPVPREPDIPIPELDPD